MRAARRAPGALVSLAVVLACAGDGGVPPSAGPAALPEPARDARPARLLLLSIAGLTPDRYLGASGDDAMPTLAALARRGVAAQAVRTVAPASIYPAHASLVTGRAPAEHGVPADLLLGERGVRAQRYWHASHLRATTLWQLAGQAGRRVAALGWPTTLGAQVAQLVPDVVPTRRGESWMGLLADAAVDAELLERVREAGGENPAAGYAGPMRDTVLAGVACGLLGAPRAPELLLLRLSQTEPVIAADGADSLRARAAFRRSDAELARLLDCLRDAGRLSDAALAVVGDHGAVALHTSVQPNVTLAREGLLRASASGGVQRWSAIARSNGGSAFVYARDDVGALGARRALEAEGLRSGAFRVVSAREMLELGADPAAWFGLEARPGYAFSDLAAGPELRPAAARAGGGYLPERPEMNAGFVAWGSGVREGVRIPAMRQTDVAPTLALLLGLALADVEGRPLVGALAPAVLAGARAAGTGTGAGTRSGAERAGAP